MSLPDHTVAGDPPDPRLGRDSSADGCP